MYQASDIQGKAKSTLPTCKQVDLVTVYKFSLTQIHIIDLVVAATTAAKESVENATPSQNQKLTHRHNGYRVRRKWLGPQHVFAVLECGSRAGIAKMGGSYDVQ